MASLDDILGALQEIAKRLDSDEYEYSDPYTIGGVTGEYTLYSPYNTEAEWAIVSALGQGTFGFVAPTGVVYANAAVPATAGNLTIFTGDGELLSATVTTAGTANLTFQDDGGNVIGTVIQPGTVGQYVPLTGGFSTSLVANKTASTPVVTVSYLQNATAGTLATPASFVIGARNPSQPTLSATGATTFSAFGNKDGNQLSSYVGALTQQAPFITYAPEFMPLQGNTGVFLQVSAPANTAVYVTLQLRRKLEFLIPTVEYRRPHTHTPLSARGARTFMAGFDEAMYRIGMPINPQPEQDPGRFKRAMGGLAGGEYQAVPDPRTVNPMRNLDRQVSLHNLKGEPIRNAPKNPRERRPRRVT